MGANLGMVLSSENHFFPKFLLDFAKNGRFLAKWVTFLGVFESFLFFLAATDSFAI